MTADIQKSNYRKLLKNDKDNIHQVCTYAIAAILDQNIIQMIHKLPEKNLWDGL